MSGTGTRVEDVAQHIEQATAKLKDLVEIHIPVIETFVADVTRNPLVTAFASTIPGGVGAEAMAVLNGLLPILGALGTKTLAQPAVPTDSPSPGQTGESASPATPAEVAQ